MFFSNGYFVVLGYVLLQGRNQNFAKGGWGGGAWNWKIFWTSFWWRILS